jgi:hypothetical protein
MSKCKVCETTLEEGQDLCQFCLDLSKQETKVEVKVKKIKHNPLPQPKYVDLKCSNELCNKKVRVRVNNPELYTEEVKKTWKCVNCDIKRR